jgi:hypothetical protein
MANISKTQIAAAFEILRAVADTIRELGEVPSSHLYARLTGTLSLQEYQQVITTLKNAGLVAESDAHLHLLRWTGPALNSKAEAPKPMKIDLSRIPETALETVREIADTQGEQFKSAEDFARYIQEDEEALEVLLTYIDTDL